MTRLVPLLLGLAAAVAACALLRRRGWCGEREGGRGGAAKRRLRKFVRFADAKEPSVAASAKPAA